MFDFIKILAATVVGSTVLTTLITDILARRREKNSHRRAQVEEMSKLYEETLSLLELSCRRRCLGDAATEEALVRLDARLKLKAPSNIYEQFCKSGWALEAWAAAINKAEKPLSGGGVMISSGMQSVREEAARLVPLFEQEVETLTQLMRAHLAHLSGADGESMASLIPDSEQQRGKALVREVDEG